MSGIDGFIQALGVERAATPYREKETSALSRNDASVKSIITPSPLNGVINRAYDGLALFKTVVLVLPLSWFGGVMVAISTHFRVTGNPFVDGTLVALLPWAVGFAIYKWIERVRSERFGPKLARPPLGARDAILTMAAAMGGPLLLVGFVPRAAAPTRETVDFVVVLIGLYFCWIPIGEIRKCLREP
jgi:hypothetical protein